MVKLNWPNHSFGAADFQHQNGWEHIDGSKVYMPTDLTYPVQEPRLGSGCHRVQVH